MSWLFRNLMRLEEKQDQKAKRLKELGLVLHFCVSKSS